MNKSLLILALAFGVNASAQFQPSPWNPPGPPQPNQIQLKVDHFNRYGQRIRTDIVTTDKTEIAIERKNSVVIKAYPLNNPTWKSDVTFAEVGPNNNKGNLNIPNVPGSSRIEALAATDIKRPITLQVRPVGVQNQFAKMMIVVRVLPVAYNGFTSAQAEVAVSGAYDAILGRPADIGGLSQYASSILSAQQKSGAFAALAKFKDVLASLAQSQEFMANRSGVSAEEMVNSLYTGILKRAPDLSSGGYRSALIQAQAKGPLAYAKAVSDVSIGLATSPEFFDRVLGEVEE